MTTFGIAGSLLGGLGLFILGVGMITGGLKLAGGDALKDLLGRWTSSIGRGIASGLFITAVVQSSSAVTVATIGFVNAGLITLRQACGVIYGSNVGTTMTGWLVSLVGFGFKIDSFALPFIGVGAILQLTGEGQRRGAFGTALVGFGLFFVGIDVLKGGFDGLSEMVDLSALASQGVMGLLTLGAAGFALTFLTQSSSASIALIITATVGGVLSLDGAIAMVIGANVGTTSTAMLAVIGATANAKRVAAAHMVFNVVTGCVAFGILPATLWMLDRFNITNGNPAFAIAIFHTAFNVLGVAVMWPLTPKMASFLDRRFRSEEDDERNPRYLDQSVLEVPALALNALILEMNRISGMVSNLARHCLNHDEKPLDKSSMVMKSVIEDLTNAVYDFATKMQSESLPADVADALPVILRTTRYYTEISELAVGAARHRHAAGGLTNAEIAKLYADYKDGADEVFQEASDLSPSAPADVLDSRRDVMDQSYNEIKKALVQAAVEKTVPIAAANHLLDATSAIHRAYVRAIKAADRRGSLMRKADPTEWLDEAPRISDDEGPALN